MPDRDALTTGPGPQTPEPEPSTGLADPRGDLPGPQDPEPRTGVEPTEAPDVDTPAWEGPGPDDRAPGLVDPRHEVRDPAGP